MSLINNAVAQVNAQWNQRLGQIQSNYRSRADRRKTRYDAMDSEVGAVRDRLKALKPEGARPMRMSKSMADTSAGMGAGGYTRPSMVGGSGHIPSGVTAVNDLPVPSMRAMRTRS
jgi:hypothetical protein